MAYTVFFWDFDGTLYNSYPRMESDLHKALMDEGIVFDEGLLRRQLKRTLYQAILFFVNEDEAAAQNVMEKYQSYAKENPLHGIFPFRGAKEALQAVVDAGGQNFLYTHRDNSAIEALMQDNMDHLFSGFITQEDGYARKPAPDALLQAAKLFELNPKDCIMVGDRIVDAKAANNAGMAAALIFYEAKENKPPVPIYPSFTALLSDCLRKN